MYVLWNTQHRTSYLHRHRRPIFTKLEVASPPSHTSSTKDSTLKHPTSKPRLLLFHNRFNGVLLRQVCRYRGHGDLRDLRGGLRSPVAPRLVTKVSDDSSRRGYRRVRALAFWETIRMPDVSFERLLTLLRCLCCSAGAAKTAVEGPRHVVAHVSRSAEC